MDKIVVTGVSGVAIKASQSNNSGKDAGFSCVNKAWLAKCKTFDDVLNTIADEKRQREDIIATAATMRFVPNGKTLQVQIGDRAFVPTPHALNQVANWANHTPQTYVKYVMERDDRDNGNVETLATVLQDGHRAIDSAKKFRFRTYSDGTLRAMLSTEYAPIGNEWLIDVYRELMPDALFSHWRGDADIIRGNILIPDNVRVEDDSDYGGGIAIGNSEIGTHRRTQDPFGFRWICFNGNIWDMAKGERDSDVHRGRIDLVALRSRIVQNVDRQIPLLASAIDRLLGTKSLTMVPQDVPVVLAQLAIDHKIEAKAIVAIADQYSTHESAFRSLFGIVNAVTRASQTFELDSWVKFDTLGGSLTNMDKDTWLRLVSRGRSLSAKQVEAAFGIAS